MTVSLRRIRKGEKLPWIIEDIDAESFPPEVRFPHGLKQKLCSRGDLEFFLIEKDRQTVGFAAVTVQRRTAYLVFLVIGKRWQHQGIGSYSVRLLRQVYPGKVIGLECEEDKTGFYLKNGFRDTGYCTEFNGMRSVIMSDGDLSDRDMEVIRKRFEKYS